VNTVRGVVMRQFKLIDAYEHQVSLVKMGSDDWWEEEDLYEHDEPLS